MDRTSARSIVTLDRGDRTTRVAWARGKANVAVSLPAYAPQAMLVTHLGETQIITPADGVYRLSLPGALCNDPKHGCAVGGAPLLVVEDAPSGNVIHSQTTSNVTATPAASLTPTATATVTPSPTPTATASATPALTATSVASPTPTQAPDVPQVAPDSSTTAVAVALALTGGAITLAIVLNRRKTSG